MLTTLTPDDWTSAGKSREYNMSIYTWFKNHHHKEDEYRILMGDIYMSDGKVDIDFDNVTTNSVERFAV